MPSLQFTLSAVFLALGIKEVFIQQPDGEILQGALQGNKLVSREQMKMVRDV